MRATHKRVVSFTQFGKVCSIHIYMYTQIHTVVHTHVQTNKKRFSLLKTMHKQLNIHKTLE